MMFYLFILLLGCQFVFMYEVITDDLLEPEYRTIFVFGFICYIMLQLVILLPLV